jgi:hypothetical protein
MQPFVEDLTRQFERKATELRDRVGLTLDDLESVASGEVALALVRPAEREAAVAVLADVTGREAQAQELLRKLDANLTARRARKQSDTIGNTRLTTYTLPPREGRRVETVVVFLHDQVLSATSHREVAEGILARFAEGAQNRLADVPAYRETLKRCRTAAGELAPDLRWFIEPFGFTYAYRELQADRPGRATTRRKDVAEILQRHGFDAIQGLGGFVNLHSERGLELLHRTSIYAPAEGPASSAVAMQLLQFPAGGDLIPPEWVPDGVATYVSLNWDVQNAFDHVAPLADDLMLGKDNFATVLEGIATDPHGPQVDIRREVVAHLGQRISIVTDYELPITPQSERFVFAIESANDEELADAIRRLMEPDKWRKRHEFQGHVLWETVEEPIDDPLKLHIDDGDEQAAEDDEFDITPFDQPASDTQIEPRKPKFPHSAIAVANGNLWIASHIDYLKDVLTGVPSDQQLAQAADFERVKSTIGELAPESLVVRGFSRTDQEYRPTFELLRQGMMPKSETLLGRVLNEFLAEEDIEVRAQRLDASKLPPFEEVEQYFGPAGVIVSPETDGWFVVGAMLSSDRPELARRPQK